MMKAMFLAALILILLSSNYSQIANQINMKNSKENNEIIILARNAIGISNEEPNSFHIKLKQTFLTKVENIPDESTIKDATTELNILNPDQIQTIWSIETPFPSKTTSIWNGKNFKRIVEFEVMGKTVVQNISDTSRNKGSLKALDGKIDKEKLDRLKDAKLKDPKEDFYNQVWFGLFPLILSNPFESNIELKYVGKAEASNQIANVVDFKSKNGRNYRLLFDSLTNYLLMMVVNYKGADGEYEIKYYYSNREKVGNILIPRKIKVENKITLTGKEPRLSHSNIDVMEFKLNPEFKENIFHIK